MTMKHASIAFGHVYNVNAARFAADPRRKVPLKETLFKFIASLSEHPNETIDIRAALY